MQDCTAGNLEETIKTVSCYPRLVSDAAAYVMGHNDRERRRLILQASLLNPFTQQLFGRAGISSGMNVLDLGCGVGDVSILAARLVGPYGSVTSVDFDNAALETLEARTAQKEFKHPVRAGQCRGMEAAP